MDAKFFMIRLTLNAKSDPEIHVFYQETILIGSDPTLVDLLLIGPEVQPVHLKISMQNEIPTIINEASDPHVVLNGHPFTRKLLNSGDVIALQQTIILFENLQSTDVIEDPLQNKMVQSLLEIQGKKESSSSVYPFSLFESQKESGPSVSLKDDYLKDLDDENQKELKSTQTNEIPSDHLYQAWKWIFVFIFSSIFIFGGIGLAVYLAVSDRMEANEIIAAQGVSDIAMALTHAQLHHVNPHNQNWSDIEFLKKNLQSILPNTHSYASQIDSQGQFHCCPYSLRIYTSSDLSRFLLVAQPDPGLLYSLIAQTLIVLDSDLMELRIVKDVRGLNRLLANRDPLDGSSGKEITELIKLGRLIRLSTLAEESVHLDFAPPKNLSWVRPGSENYIYNSPRYHRFGFSTIQKAIALSSSKAASQEVEALKREVEIISSYSDLILYTDQGKKSAELARQGIASFAPSDALLFGYLYFNAQGKIHQVHLLKDDEEVKEVESVVGFIDVSQLPSLQNSLEIGIKEEVGKNIEKEIVDITHPIYIQLQSLLAKRKNELQPAASAIYLLVQQDFTHPKAQFQIEFQNHVHSYLIANTSYKKLIEETLEELRGQYLDMPAAEFTSFIKAFDLEGFDEIVKVAEQAGK